MLGDNLFNNYYSTVPTMINDLIKVNGIEGARAYPIRPNCRIPLFDANEDIMYIKSADAGGYATIDAYDFFRKEPEKISSDNSENDKKYITIEDFNNLKDIIVTKNDFENFKEELINGKFSIQQSNGTEPDKSTMLSRLAADARAKTAARQPNDFN